MQQIEKILRKASPIAPSASSAKAMSASGNANPSCSEPARAAMPRNAAMRRFWARMVAIYGHKWASAYGDACERDDGALTVAGDTWQRGLAGVGERQIALGLQACLTSADPWPPTLPAFRALCLGIPPLRAVLAEVNAQLRRGSAGGGDPAPFVRLVWMHLDTYRLRHANTDRADQLIRDAYEIAREAVMRGEPLPEPAAAAIDAPRAAKSKPADPAVVAAELAKMRDALGLAEGQAA